MTFPYTLQMLKQLLRVQSLRANDDGIPGFARKEASESVTGLSFCIVLISKLDGADAFFSDAYGCWVCNADYPRKVGFGLSKIEAILNSYPL